MCRHCLSYVIVKTISPHHAKIVRVRSSPHDVKLNFRDEKIYRSNEKRMCTYRQYTAGPDFDGLTGVDETAPNPFINCAALYQNKNLFF